MKTIIAVDMDGVLCENGEHTEESFFKRKPILKNIEKINKLFGNNNYIIIYTARKSYYKEVTEYWLKKYKVGYNVLITDKLIFDFYIDEKRKIKDIEEV